MAKTIPLAVGYGIPEKETWTMTPAEIIGTIEARSNQHMSDLKVVDILFAGGKALYASAHGVQDADYSEFRMYRDKNKEEDMTPAEWEHHLRLIAATYKPEDA